MRALTLCGPAAVLLGLGLSVAACDQSNDPGTVDGAAAQHLKVTYQGTDYDVDLSTLTPSTSPDGNSAVLLSDVVQKTATGRSLATLKAGFRASDGYDPSSKSNCDGLVPVPGDKLDKGYVELGTQNLVWAADLKYPGCLHIKSLAQVLLTDATSTDATSGDAGSDAGFDLGADHGAPDAGADAQASQIKVTYNSTDTMVDVTKLQATATDAGTAFVLLSEVVLVALPGKDLTKLKADFHASDGYDPSTNSNCTSYLPVAGDNFAKGYLDVSSLVLRWDTSLSYPGCLKITGLAQILVADK